jgi:hypothetical protein
MQVSLGTKPPVSTGYEAGWIQSKPGYCMEEKNICLCKESNHYLGCRVQDLLNKLIEVAQLHPRIK